MRYFISIDYDESNTDDYQRVNLSESFSDKKWKFDSGDFVKDWFNAIKHMIVECPDETFQATYSSSVDHFIMDGAPFDSMYLHFEGDEVVFNKEYKDGIEIFVKRGTEPSWKELKDYCKDV